MSRIGKQPVEVPAQVEVQLAGPVVTVTGPLGELVQEVPDMLGLQYDDGSRQILVTRRGNSRRARALHGLHRNLIANAVQGVSQGFEKRMELHGTGYSVSLRGSSLVLQVGFCHEVVLDLPEGIECHIEVPNAQLDRPATFSVKGVDKAAVGQTAATIRAVRPPEPYKGKGIRYRGEYVRRKEGKAFAGTG
jgi:large subunit ribosomal protein L6